MRRHRKNKIYDWQLKLVGGENVPFLSRRNCGKLHQRQLASVLFVRVASSVSHWSQTKQVKSLHQLVVSTRMWKSRKPMEVFPLIFICISKYRRNWHRWCLFFAPTCAITVRMVRCTQAHNLLTASAGVEFLLHPHSLRHDRTSSSSDIQSQQM